jgi:hypothetical protein
MRLLQQLLVCIAQALEFVALGILTNPLPLPAAAAAAVGYVLQLLPAVLAAAADAGSIPIIVTSGPSAVPGAAAAKPSGGLFAFAPKLGGGGKGRAAALAEKAGVDSFVVITAAGLNAAGEEATSQNLVVAEAGTVDPATAGRWHAVVLHFMRFIV